MRWPGSGLAAGVLCLVRPRGKAIRFCLTASGVAIAAGAASSARMPVVPTAVAVNRAEARGAYWTHAMIASTGTAAHAVVFIAQATASTKPARTSLPRLTQASARQVSAITGGSVTPSASGKAITGDAAASAVSVATRTRQSAQSRSLSGDITAKAAATSAIVVSVTQIRGSPRAPARPAERGRPNNSMTGRYGL